MNGNRRGRKLTVALALVLAVAAAPTGATPPITVTPLPGGPAVASATLLVEYATADESGVPVPASGLVYLPRGAAPAGGWPVVSWGYGTAGVGDHCAASVRLRAGEPPTQAAAISAPAIAAMLNQGYAVAATDYAGLGTPGPHHYLSAVAEGNAVIDIVRAARAADSRIGTAWASAGHSQGGQAALMAGRLADTAAPELDFRGTVAFAPETTAEYGLSLLGPELPPGQLLSSVSSLLVYLLHGLRSARPDLPVNDYLSPLGRAAVDAAESRCATEQRAALDGVPPRALLARPLADPPFAAALHAYMGLPGTGWTHSVRVLHGTADQVVPLPLNLAFTTALRAAGADVELDIRPGVDHFGIVDAGLPAMLANLQTVLD
ncbi:alpha/beta hydrolase family protein [Nocardia sp. NPDC057353]|uniref:alpha/beta hydrolase family protein n=1 Tax=Nocardia sp. NPDC057353 TaxID=3346104 RepID=UPI00363203BC